MLSHSSFLKLTCLSPCCLIPFLLQISIIFYHVHVWGHYVCTLVCVWIYVFVQVKIHAHVCGRRDKIKCHSLVAILPLNLFVSLRQGFSSKPGAPLLDYAGWPDRDPTDLPIFTSSRLLLWVPEMQCWSSSLQVSTSVLPHPIATSK